jgi:hypothetical protein
MMPTLGVLFDIDELGEGLYGFAAYKVLFNAIDTRKLAGCELSDGDAMATLEGRARHYCIAITSPDPLKLRLVRSVVSTLDAKGLLPVESRFLEHADVSREPLVNTASIDSAGQLIGCKTGWVMAAWQESSKKHETSR